MDISRNWLPNLWDAENNILANKMSLTELHDTFINIILVLQKIEGRKQSR